ncbi:neurotensin receptor R8 [Escherichia coli]|jgi:hypothetical protein|nr:neurotensin receptor R8 [Escherichia coli]ODG76224.1 neurotensin receptor R8 [Shigella sp. FC2045]ODG85095.1 neurotensin receptor R8 [Shigella sp. FC2928]EFB5472252.1 neurotensin receptor R8 [Escherichia coli]EFI4243059.1 neurotensin receptor R8 [Escherichia coli]
MTDITDRHTLRRMSWAELSTTARDAESKHDYESARILWSYAYSIATTSINKNLASAHIRYCDKNIHLMSIIKLY